MSKSTDSDRPETTDIERWRNVCDAIAETIAEYPDSLRETGDDTSDLPDALSLRMELREWARPDEPTDEHILRLKRELLALVSGEGVGEKSRYDDWSGERLSFFIEELLPYSISRQFIQMYLKKIADIENAAGLPSSINAKTQNPIQAPSTDRHL